MSAHFEVWYAVTWFTFSLLVLGLYLAWKLDGLLATQLFVLCEVVLLVVGVLFALDVLSVYVMLAVICGIAFVVGAYWITLTLLDRSTMIG